MSLKRWCQSTPLLALLALLFLVVAMTPAQAATMTRTETFDADVGNFTASNGNHANGNNFDWAPSASAGGPAGELGGVFARTEGSTNAYVADASLGGVLSQGEDLVISGKMYLQNISWNAALFVGYFDTANNDITNGLGMIIEEPSGRPEDGFRVAANVRDTNGGKQSIGFQGTPLTFELIWDADASGDGSGILSGNVNGFPLDDNVVGPGLFNYNAFGVGAGIVGSSDPDTKMIGWFDDLTYSITEIPEPTGVMLLGLGIAMIGLRRKHS